jgi:hypothetical protein
VDKPIAPRQDVHGGGSQSEDLIIPTAPKSLADIFAAFDQTGVPEEFLSPFERAQEPSQERDFLCDKPKP